MKRHKPLASQAIVAVITATTFTAAVAGTIRDPRAVPFSRSSIWNTPIGSNANYSSIRSTLGPMDDVHADIEYIVFEKSSNPLVPIYQRGSCGTKLFDVRMPSSFSVAKWRNGFTPNSCSAFVRSNNRTVRSLQPLQYDFHCSNKWSGYYAYDSNYYSNGLYGNGRRGSHFGSILSTVGGSVRKNELTDNNDINHVLKVEFDWRHLYRSGNNRSTTYRWPAYTSDNGWQGYSGGKSSLRMGSLVALSPGFNISSSNLKTKGARKIAKALKNWGAYVVDTTGANFKNRFQVCITKGAAEKFKDTYGYPFNTKSGQTGNRGKWFNDMRKIWDALKVVTNNSSSNVGGGGSRRATRPSIAMYGGLYRLENKSFSKVLKSNNSSNDVRIANDSSNKSRWQMTKSNSTNYFRLRNINYDKFLEAKNSTTNIRLASKSTTNNRTRWRLIDAGDNYFRVENKNYGKWLRAANSSTGIELTSKSSTGNATRWKLKGAF